jgi:two-component system response regulator DesR
MRPVIRVLIADDQELVRTGFRVILEAEGDIEVVAEADRGDKVVPRALACNPDVAVIDIEMPGIDGLDAAALLHAALPGCTMLMLTTFGRPGYLARAMRAGVRGFLVKDAPAAELATAIRRVLRGGRVIDPGLAAAALTTGPNPLTTRECAVLRAAAQGDTVADIAAALSLSEGTVRNYLSTAIAKTGARNRVEAARLAAERGWL